jgi:hypothetical protein
VERIATSVFLCIKGIACEDFSSTHMKTLIYDPLNPEHEATGRVSWVDSMTCKYTLAFSTRGLQTSSRYDRSKINIEIMFSYK